MEDDDPYQPPKSFEESSVKHPLTFSLKTWRKVFLLFISPTTIGVILFMGGDFWPMLKQLIPMTVSLSALGINFKLSKICADHYDDTECDRAIVSGIWFVMWGVAQLFFNLLVFASIGGVI